MNIRDRMQRIADDLGLDQYDAHTKAVLCAFAWQDAHDEVSAELCVAQERIDKLERRLAECRER